MMQRIARIASALAFAGALVACEDQAPQAPIVLGAVYNTSGQQAVLDIPALHGSQLAAAQINAEGGVQGHALTLVVAKGNSDLTTIAAKTQELIDGNTGLPAVLGLSDTDMVLSAAPIATAQGLLFLTSGATSPQLPGQVEGDLFLACFGDNAQAAAAAEWAYNELGARTATVLFDPSESYTRLLQGYFVQRFTELGGVVAAVQSIDAQSADVDVPNPGEVDLVFLSAETAEFAAPLITKLRAGGYSGPVMGGDGYDAAAVWANYPEIKDVYFATHVYLGEDSPKEIVQVFLEAYAAAYPGEAPSAFAALGYDAVGLMVAAIKSAGSDDPAGIAEGLFALENYQGVTGTISFNNGSHIPTKSVTIMQISNGNQAFATEVVPLSVPAP